MLVLRIIDDHFAKTGSGQAQKNLRRKTAMFVFLHHAAPDNARFSRAQEFEEVRDLVDLQSLSAAELNGAVSIYTYYAKSVSFPHLLY